MSNGFEDLKVWKKACDLVIEIYNLLKNCKDYSIKDQIIRAALSVPSNIAEGYERKSNADFKRFLTYAQGSAAELRTQLYITKKVKILNKSNADDLISKVSEISRMLNGLYKSLN